MRGWVNIPFILDEQRHSVTARLVDDSLGYSSLNSGRQIASESAPADRNSHLSQVVPHELNTACGKL